MDTRNYGKVRARRKRDREDKARRATSALYVYTESGRDLRTALLDLLTDSIHLANETEQPLERTDLEGIIRDAMWCASDEEDREEDRDG